MRSLRLLLYFVVGLFLSAVFVIPAHAGSYVYPYKPIIEAVATQTVTAQASKIIWAAPVVDVVSTGRLPVTINMVATRIVTPAAVRTLALGALRGSIQGIVVSAALQALMTQNNLAVVEGLFTKSDTSVCTADCYKWCVQAKNGASACGGTALAAFAQAIAQDTALYGVPGLYRMSATAGRYDSKFDTSSNTYWNLAYSFAKTARAPDAGVFLPATDDEVFAAIDPGLTSDVGVDLVKQALDKSVPVPASDPVLSGPAESTSAPSVSTTTNNVSNVTNTTTTTTITNNVYNNNAVNYTVKDTSKTVSSDGTSSTTTSDPQPDTTPAVSDAALPDLPVLYVRKYPDGMEGAWTARSAEMKATPLFSLGALFNPGYNGGTCPGWTFNMNLGPYMNFGQGVVQPPCWLWPALKACLIITALLISRRLVFGG